MSGIQSVSFTSPGFDYAAEQTEIERRRKMAELLQAQAATPLETNRMAGGLVIPISPWEGAAKLAQGAASGIHSARAKDEQKALAERSQADYRSMVSKGLRELQGTPAMPGGDYEDSMGIGRNAPGVPAQAPDPMAALGTFGGHPMGAQFAPLAMQQIQRQQMIQALRGGSPGGPAQGGAPAQQGAAGGQPPQQAGGAGGPAAGIPMETWLQIDPSGKAYMEALAKQNTPVALREGDLVAPDGKGGYGSVYTQPKLEPGMQPVRGPGGAVTGAQAIPGYAEGAATITQGKEGARAGFDMVTVNTPQGPQFMTRAQAAQLAGGGQPSPPAPQQPGPQPIQPMPQGGGMAPTQNLGAPMNQPQPGALPSGPQAMQQVVPGGAPRTVEYAPQDYGKIPMLPRGGKPGIPLQDQGSQRTEVEIGEGLGKRYNSIQDAGFAANQKINKLSRLGNLLDSTTTGKLSPAGYDVAAYMASIGMPVSKTLPNAQAAKAAAQEFALELRNPSGGAGMPGAMSDADRQYLNSLVANIDKDKATNKEITQAMTKMAERERDIAKLAREYKKKGGTFDEGFYDELDKFSKQNPLFGDKMPATVSPSTQSLLDKYAPQPAAR